MRIYGLIALCALPFGCGPAEVAPPPPPPELVVPRLALVNERLALSAILGGDTQADHLLLSTLHTGVVRLGLDGPGSEIFPEEALVVSASATVAVIFPSIARDRFEVWDLSQPVQGVRLAERTIEVEAGAPSFVSPQQGPVVPGVLDVVVWTGIEYELRELDVRVPSAPKQRLVAACPNTILRSPGLVLCEHVEFEDPDLVTKLKVWRRYDGGVRELALLRSTSPALIEAALDHDRAILKREDGSTDLLVATATSARLINFPDLDIGSDTYLLGLFGNVLLTTAPVPAGPLTTLLRWDFLISGGIAPRPRPISLVVPPEALSPIGPRVLGWIGPELYASVGGLLMAFDPAGTSTVARLVSAPSGSNLGLRQTPSGILTLTDRGLVSQSESSLLAEPGAPPPRFGRVDGPGLFVVASGEGGLYDRSSGLSTGLRPVSFEGTVGEVSFPFEWPDGWEAPELVRTTFGCRAFATWYRPLKKRAAISRFDLCQPVPTSKVFREINPPGGVALFDHGATVTVVEGRDGEYTNLLDPLSGAVVDSYTHGGVKSAAAEPKVWVLGVGPESIHIRPTEGTPRSLYLPGAGDLTVRAVGWPHIYLSAGLMQEELWVISGESGVVEERIAGRAPIRDVLVGQRGVFVTTDTRVRAFQWRTP